MFWELAKALFTPLIQFFTNIDFPGFDDMTIFDVFIGIILIDVVISVIFIIMGVSSGAGDLPASVTYDYLDEKYGLSDPDTFTQASRSHKPNYTMLKARYKADLLKMKMRQKGMYTRGWKNFFED